MQVEKILEYNSGYQAGFAYAKLGWKYIKHESLEWNRGFQAGHDAGCLELLSDY